MGRGGEGERGRVGEGEVWGEREEGEEGKLNLKINCPPTPPTLPTLPTL